MKALGILQRLAGQAVERERQALAEIGAEIADVERQIATWLGNLEREAAAAPDFMTSGATLAAYAAAGRARVRTLQERLAKLQDAYNAQLERMRNQRVEEKRLERLAERRAKKAALEAAAREQKVIDELALTRGRRS